MRIIFFSFLVLFVVLLMLDIYFRSGRIPVCAPKTADTAKIKCPFLKIVNPSTSTLSVFLDDVKAAGMSSATAITVTTLMVGKQKGLRSIFLGKAPDILQLDKVRKISHCDRYARYLPELHQMAAQTEKEGQLTIQDIADMKKWIAQQEGVRIVLSSKVETALAFLGAGGNLSTGKVGTADFFAFIEGHKLGKDFKLTFGSLKAALNMIKW